MVFRFSIFVSLFLPALVSAEELELICKEANSDNKHEVYVLYQKDGTSYAYLDGRKYGFGMDFWEYEKISETQRNVYSAYYGSDELIFWSKHQTLENAQWEFVDQQRFHINRISGYFEVREGKRFISKGTCRIGKVKRL